MTVLRLGVELQNDRLLERTAKPQDPVDFVVHRSTLLNLPRAAAAKQTATRVSERHPNAIQLAYAWHYLTHEKSDGLAAKSSRKLTGIGNNFGHLRESPENDLAWESMQVTLEGLGTKHLILRTPASFTPSVIQRQRLRAFQEKHRGEVELVWEPTGLWTPESAIALGDELDIPVLLPCMSPTGRVMLPDQIRWLRVDLELAGRHADSLAYELSRRLVDDDFESDDEDDDAEMIQPEAAPADPNRPDEVVLIFGGPAPYRSLRNFVKAAADYGLLDDLGESFDDDDDVDDAGDDDGHDDEDEDDNS